MFLFALDIREKDVRARIAHPIFSSIANDKFAYIGVESALHREQVAR